MLDQLSFSHLIPVFPYGSITDPSAEPGLKTRGKASTLQLVSLSTVPSQPCGVFFSWIVLISNRGTGKNCDAVGVNEKDLKFPGGTSKTTNSILTQCCGGGDPHHLDVLNNPRESSEF